MTDAAPALKTLKIDFVSDVVCPWCGVGLGGLTTALETLESQPGGSWILGLTAVGLMAFGAFAFVEARWRRIRPPRDLKLG